MWIAAPGPSGGEGDQPHGRHGEDEGPQRVACGMGAPIEQHEHDDGRAQQQEEAGEEDEPFRSRSRQRSGPPTYEFCASSMVAAGSAAWQCFIDMKSRLFTKRMASSDAERFAHIDGDSHLGKDRA
jgi:hypothetical protein